MDYYPIGLGYVPTMTTLSEPAPAQSPPDNAPNVGTRLAKFTDPLLPPENPAKNTPPFIQDAEDSVKRARDRYNEQAQALRREMLEAGKKGPLSPEQAQQFRERIARLREEAIRTTRDNLSALRAQQIEMELIKERARSTPGGLPYGNNGMPTAGGMGVSTNPGYYPSQTRNPYTGLGEPTPGNPYGGVPPKPVLPNVISEDYINQQVQQVEDQMRRQVDDLNDTLQVAQTKGTGELSRTMETADAATRYATEATATLNRLRQEMNRELEAARTVDTGEVGPDGKPIKVIPDDKVEEIRAKYRARLQEAEQAVQNPQLAQAVQKTQEALASRYGKERLQQVAEIVKNGGGADQVRALVGNDPAKAQEREELVRYAAMLGALPQVDAQREALVKQGAEIVSASEFKQYRDNEVMQNREQIIADAEKRRKEIYHLTEQTLKAMSEKGVLTMAGLGVNDYLARGANTVFGTNYPTFQSLDTALRINHQIQERISENAGKLAQAKTPEEAGRLYEEIKRDRALLEASLKKTLEVSNELIQNAELTKNIGLTAAGLSVGLLNPSLLAAVATGALVRGGATALDTATSGQGFDLGKTLKETGLGAADGAMGGVLGRAAAFSSSVLTKSMGPMARSAVGLTLNAMAAGTSGTTNAFLTGLTYNQTPEEIAQAAKQGFCWRALLAGGLGIPGAVRGTTRTNPSTPPTQPGTGAGPYPARSGGRPNQTGNSSPPNNARYPNDPYLPNTVPGSPANPNPPNNGSAGTAVAGGSSPPGNPGIGYNPGGGRFNSGGRMSGGTQAAGQPQPAYAGAGAGRGPQNSLPSETSPAQARTIPKVRVDEPEEPTPDPSTNPELTRPRPGQPIDRPGGMRTGDPEPPQGNPGRSPVNPGEKPKPGGPTGSSNPTTGGTGSPSTTPGSTPGTPPTTTPEQSPSTQPGQPSGNPGTQPGNNPAGSTPSASAGAGAEGEKPASTDPGQKPEEAKSNDPVADMQSRAEEIERLKQEIDKAWFFRRPGLEKRLKELEAAQQKAYEGLTPKQRVDWQNNRLEYSGNQVQKAYQALQKAQAALSRTSGMKSSDVKAALEEMNRCQEAYRQAIQADREAQSKFNEAFGQLPPEEQAAWLQSQQAGKPWATARPEQLKGTPAQVQILRKHLEKGLELIKQGRYEEAERHFMSEAAADRLGLSIDSNGFSARPTEESVNETLDMAATRAWFLPDDRKLCLPTCFIRGGENFEPFVPKTPQEKALKDRLDKEMAVLKAEEWLHAYQWMMGNRGVSSRQYRGPDWHEHDAAQAMLDFGISLSDQYLSRYGRKEAIERARRVRP